MPVPPRPIVVLVARAQRLLRRIADVPIPAEALSLELTMSIAKTHVVAALAELGIADILGDRALPTDRIAAEAGTDPAATHRLLRAAAAYGICTMTRRTGTVRLTRVGKTLRRDHPSSIHDWAMHFGSASTGAAWADLAASIRTGRSAFTRVHGMSVWEWFTRHPDDGRLFAGAMSENAALIADAIARTYPWPRNATVCDIAGGTGTLLASILTARPDLRGVLVDGAGPIADAAAVSDIPNVTRIVADIFDPLDITADVYLLKDVLHDWDDERCATILGNVSATMPAGSRLLLIEVVQHPNAPDVLAPAVDLQMLTQTDGGRQRSRRELDSLLRDAGLTPIGRPRVFLAHSVLEARRSRPA